MKNINLVLGCLHAPFHNTHIWHGILKLIKDLGNDLQGIYLIGDILDLNSLSFHDRGRSSIITAKQEYRAVKVFDELQSALKPSTEKYFLYGNHEDRYLRHKELPDNNRILIDSPEEYFRLKEKGYQIKTAWRDDFYRLGNYLEVFHGELLGVNPAKRQLDKLKKSCMFVHSHRAGVYFDGNMGSYNLGCLVDINAPVFNYTGRLVKRNWIMGFGLVTLDNNGYYYAQLVTGYNNHFYYNGKKYA